YSTEYRRMKCLHPAAKNGRIPGHTLHRNAAHAEFLDEFLCASGRIDRYSLAGEFGDNFFQAILIKDGNEGGANLLVHSVKIESRQSLRRAKLNQFRFITKAPFLLTSCQGMPNESQSRFQ